jgi:hypothetical protein
VTEHRPFPTTRTLTICPATSEQCERLPAVCAEVGCQDRTVRHLPVAPTAAPRG